MAASGFVDIPETALGINSPNPATGMRKIHVPLRIDHDARARVRERARRGAEPRGSRDR